MKGNVIQLNTLHLNSVRLNGIGKVQSVSLKGGSTEDPVFPPVEPPIEPEPTPTYTLSASVTNGMVSATRNGSAVNLPFTANEGDVIVVEVTPNEGYEFNGWADGNTDNPRSITMNADVVLSAECSEVVETFTLSASVTNGSVVAKRNGVVVALPYTANEGETLVLEVTPNNGYTFEGWADGNKDNPRTIIMVSDIALSAECSEVVAPPVGNYIQFEDAEVERVLMSNGVSSDGVGITMEDAAKVTTIGTWFKGNTSIVSFEELNYFVNVTELTLQNFNNCTSLQIVGLDNIKRLGGSLFYGTQLRQINAPSAEVVGGSMCSSVSTLEEISFGANLTSIADYAIRINANLKRVVVRAATPPTLGSGNFTNSPNLIAIYVPDASLEAYKTATNWNQYADRIHPLSEIEGSLVFYDKLVGDGTAYINTEYYPTSWDNVEWDADAPSVYNKCIFGCKSSVYSVANLVYSATQTYYNFKISGSTLINEDNTKRQRRTLRIVDLGNGSYRREVADLDSGVANVIDTGWSGNDVVATNALRVFCSITSAGANEKFYKGAIRSLVITDAKTGNTIMSLKPCTFAGEAGMWDEVNGKFYGNAATGGEFSVAND